MWLSAKVDIFQHITISYENIFLNYGEILYWTVTQYQSTSESFPHRWKGELRLQRHVPPRRILRMPWTEHVSKQQRFKVNCNKKSQMCLGLKKDSWNWSWRICLSLGILKKASNLSTSLCRWTAEQGVGGVVRGRTLLRSTKEGKLRSSMITHLLRRHST